MKIVTRIVCFLSASWAVLGQGSPNIVISQIYGGGGNAGATYRNDYIELFNRGGSPVNVTGWSVQYAAAAGTSWQKTDLSGTIQPGQYYLIQEAQGTGGTTDLPTPDLIAASPIALSATAGKIVLLNSTAFVVAGTSCPGANVVDKVGFGTGTSGANCFEGSGPAPTLSNTTAALRTGQACTDSDNNALDFTAGSPNPRNSGTPVTLCGAPAISIAPTSGAQGQSIDVIVTGTNTAFQSGSTAVSVSGTGVTASNIVVSSPTRLTATLTISASATAGARTLTVATGSEQATATFTVTASPSCIPNTTIEDIQGSGSLSPFVTSKGGTSPAAVAFQGVVTAVVYNGLFVQQIAWAQGQSDDPARSNGIFVFTSTQPNAGLRGRQVCVTGPVTDYLATSQGQFSDPNSPSVTEINTPNTIVDLGTTAPLPNPVALTASFPDPNGAYDQLEKLEGMRVSAASLDVVGPSQDTFGNFFATVTGLPRPFREPGIEQPEPTLGTAAPVWNGNPERLKVNSSAQPGTPALQVAAGEAVTNITGPLHFDDRTYMIMPDAGFSTPSLTARATAVPDPQPNDLTIANFNTEHFYDTTAPNTLSPAEYATKLKKASAVIRNVLKSPDVVTLEEIETIDVLQGNASLKGLVQQIQEDGGPTYTPYLAEGNDIGGIDVAFLVKTSKVQVVSVTQENKDEQWTFNGQTQLLNDRPPLVLKARAARPGSTNYLNFTVIGVHQRSLLEIDNPSSGERVREKRARQAESLSSLIRNKYLNDNLAVAGDFNAFEFNDGYVDVIGGLRGNPAPASADVRPLADFYDPDLAELGVLFLAPAQRYSYNFRGNAQMIDHIVVNQSMLPRVRAFAIGHPNADFPEGLRSDDTRPERVSDHDQPVAYISLPEPAVDVTVAAIPSGLSVIVDGVAYTAPRTFQFAQGSTHTIGVPTQQTFAGTEYSFSSWSDGGTATHTVTVPDTNTVYTAAFSANAAPAGTFAIAGAVTARVDGPSSGDRIYTIRLTEAGSLPVSACQVSSVAFGRSDIVLKSAMPLSYGDLPGNGGNASQALIASVPPSASRFVLNLIGTCRSGAATLPFQTSVTTFR